MKTNPKILLYILMISTLGINTPLSIVGIISQIAEYFNTSIAISGLYVSSFTFTIAICGLFIPVLFSRFERKRTFISILTVFAISNIVIIFTKSIYIASFFRILSAVFYPPGTGLHNKNTSWNIRWKHYRIAYNNRIWYNIRLSGCYGLDLCNKSLDFNSNYHILPKN